MNSAFDPEGLGGVRRARHFGAVATSLERPTRSRKANRELALHPKHSLALVALVLLWPGSVNWSIACAEAEQFSSAEAIGQTKNGSQGPALLDTTAPIERTISSGEIHSYRIALTAGQFLRLIVDQLGAELTVTLLGPDGKLI